MVWAPKRHIGTNTLWVQERFRRKQFRLFKVKGTENPADLFTKHLCSESMVKCLRFLGAEFRRGRPQVAPMTKEDKDIAMDDGLDHDEPNDDDRMEAGEEWHRGIGDDEDQEEEEEEEECK